MQVPQWQVAQENTHGKLDVARCEVPPVDYKHTDEHMTEWNIQWERAHGLSSLINFTACVRPASLCAKKKILNVSGGSGDGGGGGGCVMLGVDGVAAVAGPDDRNRWSGKPVPNLPDLGKLLQKKEEIKLKQFRLRIYMISITLF